ncbi:MAG: class I adenylate-forming enzyme family protein [Planctomycetota bacterium]
MFNLSDILKQSAETYPNKDALVMDDTHLTYAELLQKVNQLANGLKSQGIQQSDRVLVACPNSIEFPIIYYAILKIGAVAVTVNILSKQSELEYYLKDTSAKAFFCHHGSDQLKLEKEGIAAFNAVDTCRHFIIVGGASDACENAMTLDSLFKGQPTTCPTEPTDEDDTAVILYTSGTTGNPKGAELTHKNNLASAKIFLKAQQATDKDVHLVALPLFHCYAQEVQLNCGLLAGSTVVLLERFDADMVLKTFEKENVTLFAAVPTIYWALLNQTDASDYDVEKIASKLRVGMSGGAAMPVEVLKATEEKFKFTILEAWGLTESTAAGTLNQLGKQRKVGSIGTPHDGIELRIVDPDMNDVPLGQRGELVMKSDVVMKSYYNRPQATAEAFHGGWLHTGDIATQDEDGYFYIVDRLKDMIIRGGYNVYPRELEEKIIEHPDVSLVAVIGVSDEKFGEEVKACVVLNDNATITGEELIQWIKPKVANYKYPRIVEIVNALPMSATGKLLKKELRKRA